MKKTGLKTHTRILIIILTVLAVLLAGGIWYLNDNYTAGETAASCLSDPGNDIVMTGKVGENFVFMPADTDRVDKALIFYPGAKVDYRAYAPLLQKLTREGVMCVLVKMPADFALFDIDAAEKIREQYPEIKEWYIGGHSLGGVAAAMNVKNNPAGYKGIVFLGSYPSADLSGTELKALSVYGENDQVLDREEYEKCRGNFPSEFEEVVIAGGNHAGFGDYGLQKGDGEAGISSEEQQEKTAELIAEWMK